MSSCARVQSDDLELGGTCVTESEKSALLSFDAGRVEASKNLKSLRGFVAEANDGSASMGGSVNLSTLVTNNMDTLPIVRGSLLQKVFHVTQGARADLIAHIQSRMDVTCKAFEDALSVIGEIPSDVVAVFRSNIASLVQVIMAEIHAASGDAYGENASIMAAASVAALTNALQCRLDSCLAAASVAMSGHVELVANGLRSKYTDSQSFADVAIEVSDDVQQILSAKVAIAMQDCFEEARQRNKGTSHPWDDAQTVPLAEMVQAHSRELIGLSADAVEKTVQVERLSEEDAEPAFQAQEFASAPNDRAVHSPSSTAPSDVEKRAESTVSSTGEANPDPRESYAASPITSDVNAHANDGRHLPGSVGHPELCSRPCALFVAGYCELGFACNFCHLDHEKAAHLDKKRRDALKMMTYEERVATILPLIRLKLVELQLDPDLLQDVSDILNTLQPLTHTSDVGRSMRKIHRAKWTKFTLRSLFWMISDNNSVFAPSALRASVDLLFVKTKREVARTL